MVDPHGAVYSPGGGVYGDSSPRDAGGDPVFAVVPSQDVNPDYYITQTVYGFLDFTTTIGNTVMIFSPQSAAPAVTEPPKTTAPPPPVIETTPTTTTTTEEAVREIKPSKTVVLPVLPVKAEKVSIVQVLPETPKPPTTKPAGPLKFIPKAVPKVAIKPILKPKPKIVEIVPVKATTTTTPEPQEQPQDRFIVKPVPKAVIIKPIAPVVKVVATKVVEQPTTTTTTEEPIPEEEEESEEEQEEQQEEQEHEESQAQEEEIEEEQQQEGQEDREQEAVEEVKPEVAEKPKAHVVEAVTPVTPTTTTTTTTEQPAEELEEEEEQAEEEHEEADEEHSPIMFSAITEDEVKSKPAPVSTPVTEEKNSKSPVAVEVKTPQETQNAEEEDGEETDGEEDEEDEDEPVPVLQIGNNIGEPEYDFLSRQPSEFVEETFRVVNLRPTATTAATTASVGEGRAQNPKPAKPKRGNKRGHPTGLVTKLGGTVVKEGVTTVHETSVIGTYISGKYAQVLQSTSHVIQGNSQAQAAPVPAAAAAAVPEGGVGVGVVGGRRVKLNPSSTLRILKTAAPSLNKTPRYNPEAVPAASIITPSPASQALDDTGLPLENLFASQPSSSLVRPSRRLPGSTAGSGNFKNRLKNRIGKDDNELQEAAGGGAEEPSPAPAATITPQPPSAAGYGKKPASRYRNTQIVKPAAKKFNRYSASSVEVATVSAVSTAVPVPAYQNRRNKSSRNGFKPTSSHSVATVQPQQQQQQQQSQYQYQSSSNRMLPHGDTPGQTTSLYKFKLNRSPGRWQYKSPAKPTVAIRKQSGVKPQAGPTGKDQVLTDQTYTIAPITDTSVQFNDIAQPVVGDHGEGKVDTDTDLDQSGSVHGNVLNTDAEQDNQIERRYPIETLKVEISTPADFRDTYYEIATIKSPYTFQVSMDSKVHEVPVTNANAFPFCVFPVDWQVGTVKNTRYITVTSTIEKVLEQETATITPSLTEPLTENILATTTHIDKESNLLDSSIATLPPIVLGSDTETPPLETLTETFSTTQAMLKTHILPVVREGDTSSYTLIQTYHVTRLVTATKTLPPMELYHFVPSKTLNEFNSRLDEAGSELHLELEFGDDNENEDDEKPKRERLPSDLDLSSIGSDFDLSEVDKTNIPENIRPKKKITGSNKDNRVTTEAPVTTPALTPEQLQQLALLRLLNPAAAAQIPSVITSSKPVVKLETVYESHVLPIINGQNTILSTISRPIGTITKTNYEIVTTTLPSLPLPPIPQLNPFLQQQQQQQQQLQQQQQQQQQLQIQSTPVVTQTIVTETNSKVLKLTFGAKTAYTTLYSTTVVPTVLTTYLTQSVSVQPTAAAFPGFFPNPYAPFPFVG
ncbi:hypothetical protein AND_001893 [Anopheles darlingi]|uniref:DUF4758 domain-containing protein n=1 Tax=Anopheles darlingi TaxID=43151 RepID=W5JSP1_ANODA|nr:hypothetical protein AND_001893 [Anopheles darlingi]